MVVMVALVWGWKSWLQWTADGAGDDGVVVMVMVMVKVTARVV